MVDTTFLHKLSPKELRKVRATINMLLEGDSKSTNDWAAFAWDELVDIASERGINLPKNVKHVSKYSDFKKLANEAVEYMTDTCGYVNDTHNILYLRLIARAIIAAAIRLRNELSVPISPKTVMERFANYKAELNLQWPGGPIEYRMVMNKNERN